MQKPVNKKIMSKKVIETSRLHLTYADVYKKDVPRMDQSDGPLREPGPWTTPVDHA